jgi:hypothetical protein
MDRDDIIVPEGDSLDRIHINADVLKRWAKGDISPEECEVLPLIVLDLNTAREALLENVIYSVVMFEEFAKASKMEGVTPAQFATFSTRMAEHFKDRYADILGSAGLTKGQIDEVRAGIHAFFRKKEPKK